VSGDGHSGGVGTRTSALGALRPAPNFAGNGSIAVAPGLAPAVQGPATVTTSARPLRYHFSGIAGSGMSPLARLLRAWGHEVQGSDRSFDQGKNEELAAAFRALGIVLHPQDGRAIHGALDRFVYSTAVEADTPEMQAARRLGVPMIARPALLADLVNTAAPGVAVAGTSGKSTTVGMVAWLARRGGLSATALGGAPLVGDAGPAGVVGQPGGALVAEACESDGSLIAYRPAVGLILNVSRDHAEIESLREQFTTFARQCRRLFVNAGCPVAAAIGRSAGARTYGPAPDADLPLEILSAGPHRAAGVLRVGGRAIRLALAQPGRHNLDNAAAAALVALELGLEPERVEQALAAFPGVQRRFEVIGTTPSGIRVIDDYAHNAAKIAAALATAQAGSARVVAVFQPHGFGPARFLRPELRELLPRLLRPQDRFCYAEIFYAGGTVQRDLSSAMLAADLPPSLRCGYAPDHEAVRRWVVAEARPGDTVLLMGARDPELPRLARSIFAALQGGRSVLAAVD
jgi:UDP-N-acetylmuramate--alanine ligase